MRVCVPADFLQAAVVFAVPQWLEPGFHLIQPCEILFGLPGRWLLASFSWLLLSCDSTGAHQRGD